MNVKSQDPSPEDMASNLDKYESSRRRSVYFITICPTSLHGGVNNFGSAFLPSVHQGVPFGTPGYPNTVSKHAAFKYMANQHLTREQQQMQLKLMRELHKARPCL